ncbi:MAG: choice-of-anchor tandem repeat GloVer-containing protein [Bryobacteraceae bacterium]|jgi:uncharacterized repeat protein (TIGR03803 family)
METSNLRAIATTALLTIALPMAHAGDAAYRIVRYMDQYDQPSGFTEGAPGLLYGIVGSYTTVGFTITPSGQMTILASYPSGYSILSLFMGGADGRFYSAAAIGNQPAKVFSVPATPASEQLYTPQNELPMMTQTLPDGELLAVAVGLHGAPWYVAKVGLDGVVRNLAQFATDERLSGTALYASDGNYYGLSQATNAPAGYIFKVTPSGTRTRFYNFPSGWLVGYFPAPLLESTDGNLYGAIPLGGINRTGMIYRLTLDGRFTPLYTFPKGNDGVPATLLEASDGNLYGATLGNPAAGGAGQLFRITKRGDYTRLYEWSQPARDGACRCDLIQASDGMFYGATQGAGATGAGVVFALDAGLPKPHPWVREFDPQSGPPGTRVLIWGRHLLAASVKFNGLPAAAVSNSGADYVVARVPADATTGPVTVITPGGTGVSRNLFTVTASAPPGSRKLAMQGKNSPRNAPPTAAHPGI